MQSKKEILKEIKEDYKGWAPTYDRDACKWKYTGPEKLAERLKPYLKERMKLVDLCCGTGLNGMQHKDLGLDITGVDYSMEMLEEAKKKGCYKLLVKADASRTPFRTNSFDALVCATALEYYSDKEPFIKEISRIVKPEGIIGILTYCTKNGQHIIPKSKLEELLAKHNITILEMSRILSHLEESKKPIYSWLTIGLNKGQKIIYH